MPINSEALYINRMGVVTVHRHDFSSFCSFHVGSGCQTPLAYLSALELSSEMFQYAASIGYHFTLLDIGGGFPGDKASAELFNKVTASISSGLATYFSDFSDLKIIAEPGKYSLLLSRQFWAS